MLHFVRPITDRFKSRVKRAENKGERLTEREVEKSRVEGKKMKKKDKEPEEKRLKDKRYRL